MSLMGWSTSLLLYSMVQATYFSLINSLSRLVLMIRKKKKNERIQKEAGDGYGKRE